MTDSNGQAVIVSAGKAKGPITLTVTVNNVAHANYVYDPAANVEESDSGVFN